MKPMVRVYRIEHPASRLGPFAAGGCGNVLDKAHDMPTPWTDEALRNRGAMALGTGNPSRCAFASVRQLMHWFDEYDLRTCQRCGYAFAVYAVPWQHHTLHRHQVVFNVDHALRLRTLPIVDLRVLARHDQQMAACRPCSRYHHGGR